MPVSECHLHELLQSEDAAANLCEAGYFSGDYISGKGTLSRPLQELGFTLEDMLSGRYQEMIHPHDRETYQTLWNRVREGLDNELYCEYRLKTGEDNWFWIRTHALVMERNESGEITKIMGSDKNISSRKFAESYMRRELMDIKRRLDVSESIRQLGTQFISNLELNENHESGLEQLRQIVAFDFCRIEAYSEREQEKKQQPLISYPPEKTAPPLPSVLIDKLRESHYPLLHDDFSDDAPFKSLMAVPLRFSGRYIGAVYLWHTEKGFYRSRDLYPVRAFADILAVAVRNSRIYVKTKRDLEKDMLSGFLTRKSFTATSRELWAKMAKSGQSAAVVMMDIDQFKGVNDDFGHAAGDRVISDFADMCRIKLRQDVLLGRYGGEEFIAVIPNCTPKVGLAISDRIRSGFQESRTEGVDRSVTVSMGLTVGNGRDDLDELIKIADKALYKAKEEGRNRVIHLTGTQLE